MRVVDLTPDFAKTIAGWRYPGAFGVYDGIQRSPLVPGTDFAVIDDHDHLVGHCAIIVSRDVIGRVDLRFALDPRKMRQGRGHEFVSTVLAFAARFAGQRSCTDVHVALHEWNHVAIAVCRDAGMREVTLPDTVADGRVHLFLPVKVGQVQPAAGI